MSDLGFALFDTAIGRCAIAWGERGVVGVQLPETEEEETRRRMLRRFPAAREAAPPVEVRKAQDGIVALLRGESVDLSSVALDMVGVPPFHRRVYEVARRIPRGATLSYGDIAVQLGARGSARAVGQALGRNPFAVVVPCHRVLAAGGRVGGFSASGGISTKLRMLTIEGAHQSGEAAEDGSVGKGIAPPGRRRSTPRPGGRASGRGLPAGRRGRFGFDPRVAVEHLRAVDPGLARLIDTVGPFLMRLDDTPSVFLALAESIVYQQLTGKAAATIFGRVRGLFPRATAGFTEEHILRVSPEKLRGAGLSRAKLLALRDLAARSKGGQLPTLVEIRRMEDEAIVERLTEVRGIGRWTAQMLLMFRLGRPDVLPVDDYGIRKGFALAFRKRELPSREELEKRGARWRPYRSVASWYLWRALELAKK
jgi:O-6-methylguanine DNA methyltransferase